ncbi:hypothetical protein M0804_013133 [Polistes exclamans]|nr:hypothetical protein M0804_013133 [Polistes exclamans]
MFFRSETTPREIGKSTGNTYLFLGYCTLREMLPEVRTNDERHDERHDENEDEDEDEDEDDTKDGWATSNEELW